MLKRICSVALAALLLQVAAVPALAKSAAEKESKRAEKVRTQLAKLGTGKDALVRVELRDKTKLEGYISEAGSESFVVVNKAGGATTVAYPQVAKAKGNNLSTGAKVAIGIGIGAGITLLILFLIATSDD
jgi:tripartite-type tricarboxylate transporter receptor subunit TctC